MSNKFALSPEEIEQFHRDGCLGPFDLYSRREVKNVWDSVRNQLPDKTNSVYSHQSSMSGATNIANYDRHFDIPELSEHITRPEIVDRVNSLIGPDVLAWRSEFFAKYKGDEGTDWHQASNFSHASGRPQLLWPEGESHQGGTITVWCAFTNATKKNGCLQVMPGTHTKMNYDESKGMNYDDGIINSKVKDKVNRGFFGYDYRQLQKDPNWKPDESQAIPVEMRAGQFFIFWSTLMHASYPHRSTEKDMRMGYVCRYVPNRVQIYPETGVLKEYGGEVSLDHYGAIQVAGEDKFNHNRIVTENVLGKPFKRG